MGCRFFGSNSGWKGGTSSPKSVNGNPQNFKIIKTKTIGQNSLIYMNLSEKTSTLVVENESDNETQSKIE